MPVKGAPREREIIKMLLSECDEGTWSRAALDWVEEREDGAVEVVATAPDGRRLAIEHTLIQPFVGEKFDTEAFMRAFARIDKNPAFVVPGRNFDVVIPVHAIPMGHDWNRVGQELLEWLKVNHKQAPYGGKAEFRVPIATDKKKNAPTELTIALQATDVPGAVGNCLISRADVPDDLDAIVKKALGTKVPKLARTPAEKRILLLERDQSCFSALAIYRHIAEASASFPELATIHEIWFADTSKQSEGWAFFSLIDGRGCIEFLNFENGTLQSRRDDRSLLGPPHREF